MSIFLNGLTGFRKKTAINSILGIVISALTISCSSNDPYPSQWPQINIDDKKECRFNSAVYRNINREKRGQFDLVTVLLAENDASFIKTVFVAISQPGTDQLNVGLFNARGELIYQTTLSKANGSFDCQDGWLVRQGIATSGDSGGLKGTDHYTYQLVEQDGYLIYKKSYRSRGWIGAIPVSGSGSSWGRFHPTADLFKIQKSVN